MLGGGGGMGNWHCARLVLWLILISGFLVLALEDYSEKDEAFLTQFVAPSARKVNEHMVTIALLLFFSKLVCFF